MTHFTRDPRFNPILGAFTTLVALFTALAAFNSARAASEANEIKLLPILAIYFSNKTSRYQFSIRNLGEGPAFNIQITPWTVLLTDLKQIWELKMSILNTNLIPSKEEELINYKSLINGKEVNVSDIMAAHLHPETSSNLPRVTVTITFTNALRHKYFTYIELGKEGPKVLIPSRRLDWNTMLIFKFNALKEYIKLLWWKFIWKIQDLK